MRFDFNLYSSLLLPAFIQGMLFTVLLFIRSRQNGLSDRLLAWLLLLNTIKVAFWMLGFAGWYDSHNGYTSFMFYFPFNNLPWIGPLLYFYFLSLTNRDFRLGKRHWKHFILPVAWSLLILIKFLLDFGFYRPFGVTPDTQYGCKGPLAELDKSSLAVAVGFLSFFYYLFLTLRVFSSYRQYMTNNFSATEDIQFNWLRNLLYMVSIGIIIFFFFSLADLITHVTYRMDWYAYMAQGIIVYYLSIEGYYTLPRQLRKLQFQPEVPVPVITVQDKEPDTVLDDWKARLVDLVETKQPYLEPELTLTDLARRLNTNTSVLSRVINDGTGRNFNDFINYYRVQEVISKFQSGEHHTQTLLAIAYDCGFNSKATFNRSFKKITGKTPREFADGLAGNISPATEQA
ncbi:MAG: helix-turn-helix domain-containing protein [Chitinophagaceae bacterium]